MRETVLGSERQGLAHVTSSDGQQALVIDQDPEYGAIMADVLAHRFSVDTTISPERGLQLLGQRRYQVVLVEWSGADETTSLVQVVRSALPYIGIVVTSVESLYSQARVRCFEAGADDFVQKPFHPAELAARVDRLAARVQDQTEGLHTPTRPGGVTDRHGRPTDASALHRHSRASSPSVR